MTPGQVSTVLIKSGEHARDMANYNFTKRGPTDSVTVMLSCIGALLTYAGKHCEDITNEGANEP